MSVVTQRWDLFVAIGLVTLGVAPFLIPDARFFMKANGDLSSWVQAIFSVVAIAAAFLTTNYQNRMQALVAQHELLVAEARSAFCVYIVCWRAKEFLEMRYMWTAVNNLDPAHKLELSAMRRFKRQIDEWIPTIRGLLTPSMDAGIAMAVSDLLSALAASSHHAEVFITDVIVAKDELEAFKETWKKAQTSFEALFSLTKEKEEDLKRRGIPSPFDARPQK